MNSEEVISYWMESSDDDAGTMKHLLEKGDYSWSLFIGHIVLEKLLKAAVAKSTGLTPPHLHDLSRLAAKADMAMTHDQLDLLDTITTFNIRARYDDYKREFKAKCTREYTTRMVKSIEELRSWIKTKL